MRTQEVLLILQVFKINQEILLVRGEHDTKQLLLSSSSKCVRVDKKFTYEELDMFCGTKKRSCLHYATCEQGRKVRSIYHHYDEVYGYYANRVKEATQLILNQDYHINRFCYRLSGFMMICYETLPLIHLLPKCLLFLRQKHI